MNQGAGGALKFVYSRGSTKYAGSLFHYHLLGGFCAICS